MTISVRVPWKISSMALVQWLQSPDSTRTWSGRHDLEHLEHILFPPIPSNNRRRSRSCRRGTPSWCDRLRIRRRWYVPHQSSTVEDDHWRRHDERAGEGEVERSDGGNRGRLGLGGRENIVPASEKVSDCCRKDELGAADWSNAEVRRRGEDEKGDWEGSRDVDATREGGRAREA